MYIFMERRNTFFLKKRCIRRQTENEKKTKNKVVRGRGVCPEDRHLARCFFIAFTKKLFLHVKINGLHSSALQAVLEAAESACWGY